MPMRTEHDTPTDAEFLHEINYFAGLNYAFDLVELHNWCPVSPGLTDLLRHLESDTRFVPLGSSGQGTQLFVPDKALFIWWTRLTLNLTRSRTFRLTSVQLCLQMNSLLKDASWPFLPKEIINYGMHYGFVAQGRREEEYVFPMSRILSFVPVESMSIVRETLRRMADSAQRKIYLDEPWRHLIREGLAGFKPRDVEIALLRERIYDTEFGFSVINNKPTLKELGDRIGLTRERVRQIEQRFWKDFTGDAGPRPHRVLLKRTPFVLAMVTESIRRQGSLIFSTGTVTGSLYKFLLKCNNVPCLELPALKLGILGVDDQQNTGDLTKLMTNLDLQGEDWLPGKDWDALVTAIQAELERNPPHQTKIYKSYLALKELGKPAHYSAVYQQYQSMFPYDVISMHQVHTNLSACATPDEERYGIVWVGAKGYYALKDWGYARPSKPLFETAAQVVKEKFDETGLPVSLEVIAVEVGKHHPVLANASIIFATHLNPALLKIGKDHFIPIDGIKHEPAELSEDQIDEALREFEIYRDTSRVS